MHYAKIHFGDYTKDTTHLTLLEHGVYFQMMRIYYTNEKPLPVEPERVARFIGARSDAEREAVKNVLTEFFTLEADGWHQKRMDAEIERYTERKAINGEIGKLGGRPKKPEVNPQETETVSTSNPQITLTTNHKPLTKITTLASRENRVPHVAWSEAGFSIPDTVKTGFTVAYPAVNLDAEIAKAHAWVLANPKNRKSNWGRFLKGWLQKAQDRAPRAESQPSDWRSDPRFVGAV